MKSIQLFSFLFGVFLLFSCNHQKTITSVNGDVDARFVGKWKGSESNNQVEGATKNWEINRKSDGTFSVKFIIKYDEDEKAQTHTETGRWWLKDGKYYEYNNLSQLTDTYTFEIMNKNQIKFKAYHLSVVYNNEEYEFIDTRIK